MLNDNDPKRRSSITGLSKLLIEKNPGETFHVFLVHGMQSHGPNAYDPVVAQLAALLNLDYKWTEQYNVAYENATTNFSESPTLKVYMYEDPRAVNVQFTFVHWSPLTREYKTQIQLTDTNDFRVGANQRVKTDIINDGFGDVAAMCDNTVMEKMGKLFDLAFRMLFVDVEELHVEGPDCNPSLDNYDPDVLKNVAVVSASFGTKITSEWFRNVYATHKASKDLKTIFEEAQKDTTSNFRIQQEIATENFSLYNLEGERLLIPNFFSADSIDLPELINDSKIFWYSFSNQLVLLDGISFDFGSHAFVRDLHKKYQDDLKLRPDSLLSPSVSFPDLHEALEAFESDKLSADTIYAKHVQLTSFYDPNDFLGFKLHDDFTINAKYNKANDVFIPVARVMWLDLLANPGKAHRGAKENPFVLNIISKGWNGETSSLPSRRSIMKELKGK